MKFGLQVNCHCCTIVYQIVTELIENPVGILCYCRVKYRRNVSEKRMCGVKLEEIARCSQNCIAIGYIP